MSLYEKTGGPAFPCEIGGSDPDANEHQTGFHTAQQYGISMRDYFAAKALPIAADMETGGFEYEERVAAIAYRFADSMLEARKK